MYNLIVYQWDEAKRALNLEKHGLDFADAHLVYESPDKITLESPRKTEARKLDIAMVNVRGVVLALVYIEHGCEVRIISFRPASRQERRRHEEAAKELY